MDLPAQDESVDERRVVMRAMRADRENLVFAQHQQHFLFPDAADQFAIALELGEVDALGEVGANRRFGIRGHRRLPVSFAPALRFFRHAIARQFVQAFRARFRRGRQFFARRALRDAGAGLAANGFFAPARLALRDAGADEAARTPVARRRPDENERGEKAKEQRLMD